MGCERFLSLKMVNSGNFPGGPVVKTILPMQGGVSLISDQGAKIPYAIWPKKKKVNSECLFSLFPCNSL